MLQDGGYLPIEKVTKRVLKTRLRGYFFMERFDNGPGGKGKEHAIQKFTKRAREVCSSN